MEVDTDEDFVLNKKKEPPPMKRPSKRGSVPSEIPLIKGDSLLPNNEEDDLFKEFSITPPDKMNRKKQTPVRIVKETVKSNSLPSSSLSSSTLPSKGINESRCPICNKGLSHLNESRQLLHINGCLDGQESHENFSKDKVKWSSTIDCPLCGEPQPEGPYRAAHVKRCARTNNVPAANIMKLMETQKQVAESRRIRNIAHTKASQPILKPVRPLPLKEAPKSVNDEQLQLAKALSESITETVIEEREYTEMRECREMEEAKLPLKHQSPAYTIVSEGSHRNRKRRSYDIIAFAPDSCVCQHSHTARRRFLDSFRVRKVLSGSIPLEDTIKRRNNRTDLFSAHYRRVLQKLSRLDQLSNDLRSLVDSPSMSSSSDCLHSLHLICRGGGIIEGISDVIQKRTTLLKGKKIMGKEIREVELNYPMDIVREWVRYIYSARVEWTMEQNSEIESLADQFGPDGLARVCRERRGLEEKEEKERENSGEDLLESKNVDKENEKSMEAETEKILTIPTQIDEETDEKEKTRVEEEREEKDEEREKEKEREKKEEKEKAEISVSTISTTSATDYEDPFLGISMIENTEEKREQIEGIVGNSMEKEREETTRDEERVPSERRDTEDIPSTGKGNSGNQSIIQKEIVKRKSISQFIPFLIDSFDVSPNYRTQPVPLRQSSPDLFDDDDIMICSPPKTTFIHEDKQKKRPEVITLSVTPSPPPVIVEGTVSGEQCISEMHTVEEENESNQLSGDRVESTVSVHSSSTIHQSIDNHNSLEDPSFIIGRGRKEEQVTVDTTSNCILDREENRRNDKSSTLLSSSSFSVSNQPLIGDDVTPSYNPPHSSDFFTQPQDNSPVAEYVDEFNDYGMDDYNYMNYDDYGGIQNPSFNTSPSPLHNKALSPTIPTSATVPPSPTVPISPYRNPSSSSPFNLNTPSFMREMDDEQPHHVDSFDVSPQQIAQPLSKPEESKRCQKRRKEVTNKQVISLPSLDIPPIAQSTPLQPTKKPRFGSNVKILKTNAVTPAIDYSKMDDQSLKQELSRRGLRAMGRKRAIALLEQIYEDTHPVIDPSQAASSSIPLAPPPSKSTVDDCDDEMDATLNESGDGEMLEETTVFEGDLPKDVDSIQEAFLSWLRLPANKDVYMHLLTLKPVSFEELYIRIRRSDSSVCKLSKKTLQTILDRLHVFFSLPQNGHRR